MQTLKPIIIVLLFCFASQLMAQQTLEKPQEQTPKAEESSPSDTEDQDKDTTEQKPSADADEKDKPACTFTGEHVHSYGVFEWTI